ncbi:MAG: hypothetical protein ACYDCK_06425 [Thermoplasmatota archaeon]
MTRLFIAIAATLVVLTPLASASDGVTKSPCQVRWESGQGDGPNDACCQRNVVLEYAATIQENLASADLFLTHFSKFLVIAHRCDTITVHTEEARIRFWARAGDYDLSLMLSNGTTEHPLVSNHVAPRTNVTRWFDDSPDAHELVAYRYAGLSPSGVEQNYAPLARLSGSLR